MTKKVEAFPWRKTMAFAFSILKMSPKDFWASSPLEIAAAMEAYSPQSPYPMSQQTLSQLMGQFPDCKTKREYQT